MDAAIATYLAIIGGVAVVLTAVLRWRLHASLALLAGACCVGLLTPQTTLERYHLEESSQPVEWIAHDGLTASIRPKTGSDLAFGTRVVVVRPRTSDRVLEEAGHAVVHPPEEADRGSTASLPYRIIWSVDSTEAATDTPGFHEGDRVLTTESLNTARKRSSQTIGERLAEGFGSTCARIGILIAMASVIGRCLLDSGAADRIVRTLLSRCGEQRAPLAFLGSGFLLGIPVFFDTVFYLMVPLAKALYVRTQRDYLLYVLAIVAGATMAHSLVPPTPGPLLVAGQLGVDLLTMTLAGCAVGLVCTLSGYLFALRVNRLPGMVPEERVLSSRSSADAHEHLSRAITEADTPPFMLALIPLLLPTLLITLGTIPFRQWEWMQVVPQPVFNAVTFLGNANIALSCAAAFSLLLLWRYGGQEANARQKSIEAAVMDGGSIVLITAAGGAFGALLQQAGVTSLIAALPKSSAGMTCLLAFLVTMAIRTAQGSATVAMITSVSIFSGLVSSGVLDFHPVYLALSIGCGSKPFAWMNDSGFWVITKMSGMNEQQGLRFVTPMSAIMGFVGLAVILLGVTILPDF